MKPLLLFINLAGPIENPEHGKVFQIEIGVTLKDSPKQEATRIIAKTDRVDLALETATLSMQRFLKQFYPKHCSTAGPDLKIHEPT